MNKKSKYVFNFIVAIIIAVYALFNTDLTKDIKKSFASISDVVKEVDNGLEKENKKVSKNEMLSVYFLDVGQADSILIRVGDKNMLIDAGNNEDGTLLVNYFKELGINNFKYVVASHPHEDHIGSMDDIINNFDIDEFYMPNKITTTKTFEDMLDALDNKNMKYNVFSDGYEFTIDDAKFEVISAGFIDGDINDSSIVLKLIYGNNSFLFTGDATYNVENKILNSDIKSDVLKVGHHGSKYSTSSKFLEKVSPKYAVISVGKNNIYNHPEESTLKKLESKNIKVYRTDILGTIIFTSDGDNINIKNVTTNTDGG